jgi:hypothetical protein
MVYTHFFEPRTAFQTTLALLFLGLHPYQSVNIVLGLILLDLQHTDKQQMTVNPFKG